MLAAIPLAAAEGFRFASIDRGQIVLDDWHAGPWVNTASPRGFAGQFQDLQHPHARFGDRALIRAVPPDDFNQELAEAAAVKEYCAMTFDVRLPMTRITHAGGEAAHPSWAREATGCVPGWNFDKVLIAPDGSIAGTYGAPVQPESARIEAMPQ